MGELFAVEPTMDDITSAIAACFGKEQVPESLASAFRTKLPFATFVRVSLRCGSGLFVTEDLLRPGPIMLTVVSLQTSMAGLAMKQGKPICLAVEQSMARRWQQGTDSTQHVVCYPVGVQPAGSTGQLTFIGALQIGLSSPLPDGGHAELEELCAELGPYLLLISLTKLQDMTKMMRLPLGECACCSGEELGARKAREQGWALVQELEEDAPFGRCLDEAGPSSGPPGVGPAQSAANPAAAAAPASAPNTPTKHSASGASGSDLGARTSEAGSVGAGEDVDAPHPSTDHHRAFGEGLRFRGGAGSALSKAGPSAEKLAPFEGGFHSGGHGEEEEDPKAAAKRATRLMGAAAMSQGVLLSFRDAALEARFRQAQAREVYKLDVLFHLVYLVGFICTAALDPSGVLGASTNIWFAWILLLPALTIATCPDWYVRWRSWLMVPLTLLHMVHYRFAAAPALLHALPTTALRKLPWLLRCTGAEVLLVFPLSNKLPFSTFLPVQLASMCLMFTLLPGPCQALLPLLPASACLPCGWGVRCGAALLGAGFVLPSCVLYFAESRARGHFARVVQGMQA